MCGLLGPATGDLSAAFGAETGRPVGPINAMELSFSFLGSKDGR
jgi:hypothetical protein